MFDNGSWVCNSGHTPVPETTLACPCSTLALIRKGWSLGR